MESVVRTHGNCWESEIGEAITDSFIYENKNSTFHNSRHLYQLVFFIKGEARCKAISHDIGACVGLEYVPY